MMVTFMRKNIGTERSHDCMPKETIFAKTYPEVQTYPERRNQHRNKKRTMILIDESWKERPIEAIAKLSTRKQNLRE